MFSLYYSLDRKKKMVKPGEVYYVKIVKVQAGFAPYKIHDEVFINEESAKEFSETLEYPLVGFINKLKINYS